jgi:pentatricopeptide repeat protein
LEEKTIVSWNSIISGFSSQKQSENAQRYFSHMLQVGVIPSNYTYVLLKLTLLKINILNSMFINIVENAHRYFPQFILFSFATFCEQRVINQCVVEINIVENLSRSFSL